MGVWEAETGRTLRGSKPAWARGSGKDAGPVPTVPRLHAQHSKSKVKVSQEKVKGTLVCCVDLALRTQITLIAKRRVC